MLMNDPEGMLRHHHVEHEQHMDVAHARRSHHPMHRFSGTHESRMHHVARWWSVVTYHYASHMRRALRHAGAVVMHPAAARVGAH
ncbi:hypothetical protein [Demequina pelophila]|uniref:hypothetical protein n=1 Tax=Demequina pelophila TaxID=1638984 RepID=UPI00078090CC|nr:hypothetical protein [Demequina pelophila]